MGEFSIVHILVVLVVALIFFGPGKIASLGKDLGKGIRAFKVGIAEAGEPPKKKKKRALAAASSPRQLETADADEQESGA